ncbi:hypothetical protein EDD15DRAFT_560247 [Pisolithus albus]|nr:hypothetical protein EDD15DRAFT_560247 [Pisolithus albus]
MAYRVSRRLRECLDIPYLPNDTTGCTHSHRTHFGIERRHWGECMRERQEDGLNREQTSTPAINVQTRANPPDTQLWPAWRFLLPRHTTMVQNRRIAMEEDQREDGEEEIARDTIRRQLIIVAALLCVLAVTTLLDTSSSESDDESSSFLDTSSSESDDESSSYYPSLVFPNESDKDHEQPPRPGDAYDTRMQRVHLWRDAVTKSMSSSNSLPLKRRMSSHHDDNLSPSPAKPSKRPCMASRPSGYTCTACSVPFLSQESLHQHARMPQADEACRAAIGHHFE